MLLAIDAGNTNVVFTLFDGERSVGFWRISTARNRTGDEYAVWLTQLMASKGLSPHDVKGCVIASVVPPVTFNLRKLCQEHFGCQPIVVGDPGVDIGIRVLLDTPVGADRVVNALAAVHSWKAPLIVVDFGTATTFDVVDGQGAYAGGVIAPGINLSAEALHQAAAMLPKIDIVHPPRVIGHNTVEAMQSGVFWGYIGLIEGLLSRIKAEMVEAGDAEPITVIGTGGLSALFASATQSIEHIDTELTLRGLRMVYRQNTAS
jgi:type III pantothenate kinase